MHVKFHPGYANMISSEELLCNGYYFLFICVHNIHLNNENLTNDEKKVLVGDANTAHWL